MNRRIDLCKIALGWMLAILGGLGIPSLLKGCSSQFSGGEGPSAVGGAYQSMGFILYGLILLMLGGLVLLLYQGIRLGSVQAQRGIGFACLLLGVAVLNCSLLWENPFTRSNDRFFYQIPDGTVSIGICIGFVLLAVVGLAKGFFRL